MCKNCSLNVNVQAKKFSFSFPSPPPTGRGEKGKEKLDCIAKTLTLNKQYLHSSHQIYVEEYYLSFFYFNYQEIVLKSIFHRIILT